MKHAVCYLTTCPDCVPTRKVAALSAKAPEEEPITANPLISKYGTPFFFFLVCTVPNSVHRFHLWF